jgi:hypothetical protein
MIRVVVYKLGFLPFVLISWIACFQGEGRKEPTPQGQHLASKEVGVDEVWASNERIMEGALSGKGYSVEKFNGACDFFERLTGIQVRGNGTYFGWLANEETEEDFKKIKKWYQINRERLYWDETSKSVKVRK